MAADGDASGSEGTGYQIGDLDLDLGGPPAAPKPSPAKPAAPPAPARAKPPAKAPGAQDRSGADDIDLGGFGGGAGSSAGDGIELGLDLDTDDSTGNDDWRGSTKQFEDAGEDEDPFADSAGGLVEVEQVHERARLSGSRSHSYAQQAAEAAAVDDGSSQVARLAAYGDSPSNVFACVPYVITVVQRQLALRGEHKDFLKRSAELSEQLSEALADLGRALIGLPSEQLSAVNPQLQDVLAAGSAADQADGTAVEARKRAEDEIRQADVQIAEFEQQTAPFRDAEREAAAQHKLTDTTRKKADAMLNRVDIELRSLEAATAPADPNKVMELHDLRKQREAEQAQARAAAEATGASLGHARKALALEQGQLDKATNRRKRLVDQAAKEQAKLEKSATGAVGALTGKLEALGAAARETGLDQLGGDRGKRVEEVEKTLHEARDQVALYARAMAAYDRSAVVRGVALVGGSLAAVIGALVAL